MTRNANQLGNHKCHHKQHPGTLNKRPPSWSCNEYESLTDSAHLQIYCWSKLSKVIMGSFLEGWHPEYSLENYSEKEGYVCIRNTKLRNCSNWTYWKEIGFICCPKEYDCHHRQVTTENNSSRKNFSKLPAVRQRGWFHSVFWYSHDGA